jgi:hypothetical protein
MSSDDGYGVDINMEKCMWGSLVHMESMVITK